MVRVLGRIVLCLLIVCQATRPAPAMGWVMVEDCCGCAVELVPCGPMVGCGSCGGCEMEMTVVDECGCGEGQVAEEVTPAEEPQPAETQRPRTYAEEPGRQRPTAPEETPTPALEATEETLPPAPIAVPSSEPTETAPTVEQVMPGPAEDQAPPAGQPRRINTEGLFDEPTPTTEPAPAETTPAPAAEEPTESTGTEGLFEEPAPPAEENSEGSVEPILEEQPEAETEDSEQAETATDPLEGMFEPSTPATEPAPESQPEDTDETEETPSVDPFGHLPPALKFAGGLASREFRTWSNREGTVRYEARLIRFSPEGVLLGRTSGDMVALAFSQLSDDDLAFVRDQVRARRVLARATTLQVASKKGR